MSAERAELIDYYQRQVKHWAVYHDHPESQTKVEWAKKTIAALQTPQSEPVAWQVDRNVDYESREFFITEEAAIKNACLGIASTHITPLYAAPQPAPQVEPAPVQAALTDAQIEAAHDSSGGYIESLRAVIAADRQLRDGWVFLPNPPTPAMIRAFEKNGASFGFVAWGEMVDAAPKQEEQTP